MSFRHHAFFFKQDFVGGYRYLDRCGEFLARAEDEKGMMPGGDQTPSGGILENPELGLKLEVNTLMLRLTQEFPEYASQAVFLEYAKFFSSLYHELFTPRAVERNGVAIQSFFPFDDVAVANRETLQGDTEGITVMGKSLGMVPDSRIREYCFTSGSRHLRVKTHPATFERVQGILKNAGGRATSSQQKLVSRQNNGVRRILEQSFKHALFVDLDLTEDNPAEDGIQSLVEEVFEKQNLVRQLFYPNVR